MLSQIISICGNIYESCKNLVVSSKNAIVNKTPKFIKNELSTLASVHVWIVIINVYIWFFLEMRPLQISNFKWFDLISYQFMHASAAHLFGNMLWLIMLGASVEEKLGRIRFLFAYLFAGAVSGLGFGLLEPQSLLVGASGAIAGMLGMHLVSQVSISRFLVYFMPIGFYLLGQINASINDFSSSVAYVGHITGLFGGIVAYAVLKK